MKKLLTTTILSILLVLLYAGKVEAQTLSPANGSFPVSGNKSITVIANPTQPSTALKLRLTVNNAKVVSFSASSQGLLAIGVCDSNGVSYRSISSTKYEICADFASTGGTISNGATLGTIVVASLNSAGGDFTIEGSSDNGFLTASGTTPNTGVLGSYKFSGTSTLPKTAISDYMPSRGILGAAILFSGIVSLVVAIKIFVLDKRKELF